MGVKLSKDAGAVTVELIDMGASFREYLAKVKAIPGRRWNGDKKRWELPDDPETIMRAVYTLQPDMTAEIAAQVRNAQYQIADDLVNALPEDGEVHLPWGPDLYKFQRACVEFCVEQKKVLICDDMGLGKTLEAQSTVYETLHRAGEWSGPSDAPRTLIIAANSNLGKWRDEYEKWVGDHLPTAPGGTPMLPTIIDGKGPDKRSAQIEEALELSNIVIVNWEKLPAGENIKYPILPELLAIEWDAIIADEIHRAKNKDAQQTQGLHQLHAPIQLGLTGTPVMTNPADLWAMLHWHDPVTYSSFWRFFNEFAESYAGYKGAPVVIGVRNPDRLRHQIGPRLVRRTKKQVGIELPDKTHSNIQVDMRPRQRKMYRAAEQELFIEVKQAVDSGELDWPTFEERLESGQVETAMKMLPNGGARWSALRQIAVSPALLGEKDESGLLDWAVEVVKDAPGKQFVIWGYHTMGLDIIAHRLRKLKPSVVAEPCHGKIDRARRDELIKRFQCGDIQVLCCGIESMREGSDFQNSDTSIFLERSTVAEHNRQAEDRQHRIGQDNAVTVLIGGCRDTVQTGRVEDLERLRRGMTESIFGRDRDE